MHFSGSYPSSSGSWPLPLGCSYWTSWTSLLLRNSDPSRRRSAIIAFPLSLSPIGAGGVRRGRLVLGRCSSCSFPVEAWWLPCCDQTFPVILPSQHGGGFPFPSLPAAFCEVWSHPVSRLPVPILLLASFELEPRWRFQCWPVSWSNALCTWRFCGCCQWFSSYALSPAPLHRPLRIRQWGSFRDWWLIWGRRPCCAWSVWTAVLPSVPVGVLRAT